MLEVSHEETVLLRGRAGAGVAAGVVQVALRRRPDEPGAGGHADPRDAVRRAKHRHSPRS